MLSLRVPNGWNSIAEMQDWKWQELNPDDRDENVTTANLH
jgi:hypothetical protein